MIVSSVVAVYVSAAIMVFIANVEESGGLTKAIGYAVWWPLYVLVYIIHGLGDVWNQLWKKD